MLSCKYLSEYFSGDIYKFTDSRQKHNLYIGTLKRKRGNILSNLQQFNKCKRRVTLKWQPS